MARRRSNKLFMISACTFKKLKHACIKVNKNHLYLEIYSELLWTFFYCLNVLFDYRDFCGLVVPGSILKEDCPPRTPLVNTLLGSLNFNFCLFTSSLQRVGIGMLFCWWDISGDIIFHEIWEAQTKCSIKLILSFTGNTLM